MSSRRECAHTWAKHRHLPQETNFGVSKRAPTPACQLCACNVREMMRHGVKIYEVLALVWHGLCRSTGNPPLIKHLQRLVALTCFAFTRPRTKAYTLRNISTKSSTALWPELRVKKLLAQPFHHNRPRIQNKQHEERKGIMEQTSTPGDTERKKKDARRRQQ